MKRLFYTSLIALALFELLKVYFIMPMPGSQQWDTIDVAYFLHINRWYFRIAFMILIIASSTRAFSTKRKWIPFAALMTVLLIVYLFNFQLVADRIFLEPATLSFKGRAGNTLPDSTVVIAVHYEGVAKAYPVRYISYHHQVRDTLGSKAIMVTYCNVCRTGRVFEPVVNGKAEQFRLVGMDHFNAMFEDDATKSWWRQATGEAVTGPLRGSLLPELESLQLSVNQFFSMYPFGMIMQGDHTFRLAYDSLGKFESGKSKSKLTRTDTSSWKDKSWVVGIQAGDHAKAYDWNDLKKMKVIHDSIGTTPILLILANDGLSFAAFVRNEADHFQLNNDTLTGKSGRYNFAGKALHEATDLTRLKAYQEFWHSWKAFHPETGRYERTSDGN
jgi:hypothetical protein